MESDTHRETCRIKVGEGVCEILTVSMGGGCPEEPRGGVNEMTLRKLHTRQAKINEPILSLKG